MKRFHSETMPKEAIEAITDGFQVGIIIRPQGEVCPGDMLLLTTPPCSVGNFVWEGIVAEVLWVATSKDCPGLVEGYALTTVKVVR
ncbi:hypothetical protein AA12717_1961 [Gluconacetobacter sacchari DSM 12717]|uniref:Uncharacterized protein n=2 Tax=Gluconacetobacter sacchari TaxID=92759 RepID=A0A7W4IC31_9PROT|nr:hypothetical protein [Gluconacetobacter sacchari]MBB2160119.1 hypothetical protein [Gluconacetobacter sacchari]GBQ25040.1 hypothetical protein AA12717_1961 [Gluconacetobacter sacchari DSM 12717]